MILTAPSNPNHSDGKIHEELKQPEGIMTTDHEFSAAAIAISADEIMEIFKDLLLRKWQEEFSTEYFNVFS